MPGPRPSRCATGAVEQGKGVEPSWCRLPTESTLRIQASGVHDRGALTAVCWLSFRLLTKLLTNRFDLDRSRRYSGGRSPRSVQLLSAGGSWLTRKRSLVRTQYRPPASPLVTPLMALSRPTAGACLRTLHTKTLRERARPWLPPLGSNRSQLPAIDALDHSCVGMAARCAMSSMASPCSTAGTRNCAAVLGGSRLPHRVVSPPRSGGPRRTLDASSGLPRLGAEHQIETSPTLPRRDAGLQLGHAMSP